jgi:hypothetical protein
VIHAAHLREFIVQPTLKHLADYTSNPRIAIPAAEELVMGTIAHESLCGRYLRQHPTGPGRGVGQMELATYEDMWTNYLRTRPVLADAVRSLAAVSSIRGGVPDFSQVIGNLPFAVAMIRIRYLPAPPPIPATLEGQADYHVRFYNRGGAATVDKYLRDYRRFIGNPR